MLAGDTPRRRAQGHPQRRSSSPTSSSARTTSRARSLAVFASDGVHLIGFPGCYPNAYALEMMEKLCTHPNVGAALLVSLGCEGFDKRRLAPHDRSVAAGRCTRSASRTTGGTARRRSRRAASGSSATLPRLAAQAAGADGHRRAHGRHDLRRLRRHVGPHGESRDGRRVRPARRRRREDDLRGDRRVDRHGAPDGRARRERRRSATS